MRPDRPGGVLVLRVGYVHLVAKRSRAREQPGAGSNTDLKRCRRAQRSLNLVDSRLDVVEWGQQVSRYIGDDLVDQFLNLDPDGDHGRVYDFTYDSFEQALHFSVGWRSWPLAAECEWMLPRLRDAANRSNQPDPFLLEVGAGAGAAAAILSAALQIPILAVDSHPKTLGLAEQFASRTGGTVESAIAEIADLGDVLGGRIPTAVYGMGVYRHLQPHDHGEDEKFSDWANMQHILATHQVGPHVDSFITALEGADLVLAEMMCTDYLAEMASGLLRHGYEIPKGGMRRIDGATPEGPTTAFGIHFSTADLPNRDPNLLIEMFSPLPRPHGRFESDPDNDPAAEALRLSLEPTEFIEATELDYTDGSGRLRYEVFAPGEHLIGRYTSTSRGFRSLKFVPRQDLASLLRDLRTDTAGYEEVGTATAQPCHMPAPLWGSSADEPKTLSSSFWLRG
jgi:hypothetical protein